MLYPGQKMTLASASSAIWLQKPGYLQVERRNGAWILSALKKGSTLVKVEKRIYQFHILSPLQIELYDNIKNELKLKPGLDAQVINGQVTVTGSLFRLEDWISLQKSVAGTSAEYFFQAQIQPQLQAQATAHFNQLMGSAGLLPTSVFFSPHPEIRLSKNERQIDKYKDKLKSYGIEFVIDEKAIDLEPVIKIEMSVLEVNKNQQKILGLKWPGQAQAEISPTLKWESLNLTLNALEQNGEAKILASPNVLCRSGKECQFFVGGEFPIKITTQRTKEVIWKNYGIFLKFNPLADASGRMSLGLQSEVSYLDPSLKVDDVPALKTNRLTSYFDLEKSRIIILSGLLKEQNGISAEQLPFLSKISLLGKLFQSENYLQNKSELIILVKPSMTNYTNDVKPKHLRLKTNDSNF